MKNNYTSIWICLFLLSLKVFSQTSKVDSLLVLLPKTSNSIDKAVLLNNISDTYKTIDANKMLFYANEALTLAM